MKRFYRGSLSVFFFFLILSLCSGCGKKATQTDSSATRYAPGQTQVLLPEAKGTDTESVPPLTLDFSHKDQGYFCGTLSEKKKVNIQLTGPDNVTYKYFIQTPDVCTVFPFTAGSGNYILLAFENIGQDQYTPLLSCSFEVKLEDEFLPFLYPNQYVDFSEDSQAVALAAELSANAKTDLDALSAIYEYITETITYDDEKAASVEAGYLPDIDETLQSGKGICFDYAALTAAMLRSLAIPAQLNIGYSSNIHHAWVDVYIQSIGWVVHAVEFSGNEWNRIDPTFAAAMTEDLMANYIGNGENYIVEYVR